MQTPIINTNGDTAETLANQYWEALKAVRAAQRAVAEVHPNPRNFYPLGPDAYAAAVRENEARLEKLEDIAQELSALCDFCFAATAN